MTKSELELEIKKLDRWLEENAHLATEIREGEKYPPKKYRIKMLRREMLSREWKANQDNNQ